MANQTQEVFIKNKLNQATHGGDPVDLNVTEVAIKLQEDTMDRPKTRDITLEKNHLEGTQDLHSRKRTAYKINRADLNLQFSPQANAT